MTAAIMAIMDTTGPMNGTKAPHICNEVYKNRNFAVVEIAIHKMFLFISRIFGTDFRPEIGIFHIFKLFSTAGGELIYQISQSQMVCNSYNIAYFAF